MKTIYLYTTLLIAGLVVLGSCKDDTDNTDQEPQPMEVQINLVPTFDGESFELNKPFTTQEGYTVKFTRLNVILSELEHEGKTLTRSGVYKYEEHPTRVWRGEGSFQDFPSLTANVGVPASRNHEDPSAWDDDDPLHILNTDDMHWGWNTGYIFLIIEGKADTTDSQNGENLMNFFYHTGTDELLKTVSLENLNWKSESNTLYSADLTVDIYKVFDGDTVDVDIKEERASHTMPSQVGLSDKILSNFASALKVK